MCRDGVKSSGMTATKNEAEWIMWRVVYVQEENGRDEKHDVQNIWSTRTSKTTDIGKREETLYYDVL